MDLFGEPDPEPKRHRVGVFVKCGSHRARDRLTSLMGGQPMQCY